MVDWKEGRMERKEEEKRERERERKNITGRVGRKKKEREVRRNGHSPPSTTHQNP